MERNTRQRDAIRDAFTSARRPLSAQEAHQLAGQDVRGLGIATVYRNIKALVEDGWLHPVELPGEPPRYELTGLGHHHHFRCQACDKVYDIDGCIGTLQAMLPKGFKLEGHDVLLVGRCAACNVGPLAVR